MRHGLIRHGQMCCSERMSARYNCAHEWTPTSRFIECKPPIESRNETVVGHDLTTMRVTTATTTTTMATTRRYHAQETSRLTIADEDLIPQLRDKCEPFLKPPLVVGGHSWLTPRRPATNALLLDSVVTLRRYAFALSAPLVIVVAFQ